LTEPDRRPPAQVGQLEIGFTVAAEIDAEQRKQRCRTSPWFTSAYNIISP
jgi:hypothetical protein